MEARSVIYIISQPTGNVKGNELKSVRCNISRAVDQLSIIVEIKDETIFGARSPNHILFHSSEVDPEFIECRKTLKHEAFKCNSCHLTNPSLFHSGDIVIPMLEHQTGEGYSDELIDCFKNEK